MEISFGSRLKHAWDVFRNREPTPQQYIHTGPGYSHRPDRIRVARGNERSMVTSIYNRIGIDVASIKITHCRLDDNNRFLEDLNTGLFNCLNLEANIDQTHRAFIQDVVMSMLDEGVVAIVPIETSMNPAVSTSYDILSMRTGKILEWYPQHVKVRVYNDRTGNKEELVLPKKRVAIIENPLYSVMNEPNSTLQRLIRKLSLLDIIDEQSGSGKLDMIIQLPYTVKTDQKREHAAKRIKDLEDQLKGPYGIAYTDATERIVQLNRPIENNLLKQIEYLTNLLYSQLGITQAIFDGTADEQTQLNYYTRTIEPIISAIVDEMRRKFLTKTARTQKQTITFFREAFKLVPVSVLANLADVLSRNEILTSNEFRQIMGFKPSTDPKADQLRNSNMPQPNDGMMPVEGEVLVDPNSLPDDVTNMQADTPMSELME